MRLSWGLKKPVVQRLYFADLALNETFRNVNGRGAIYAKVEENHTNKTFMYELATGKLFIPTSSPVERVDVDVQVSTNKPSIY